MTTALDHNKSQKEIILQHLKEHGSISPMTALNQYGSFRLGARIWELKREGHIIEATLEHVAGKSYAVYKLVKCDEKGQLSCL
jgi:hypothetical protein